jgi:hypothetical protein
MTRIIPPRIASIVVLLKETYMHAIGPPHRFLIPCPQSSSKFTIRFVSPCDQMHLTTLRFSVIGP